MAKALSSGIEFSGLRQTIISISELLIYNIDVEYNNWSDIVDIRKLNSKNLVFKDSRDAWCYG